MILSNNNGTFTPVAGGTGTFIGTKAAFDAVKDTLPENTVAYITDDGNGDLQPVDAVTNGDMHPVTSNAVYDKLNVVGDFIHCPLPAFTLSGTSQRVMSDVNVPAGTYLLVGSFMNCTSDNDTMIVVNGTGATVHSGIIRAKNNVPDSSFEVTAVAKLVSDTNKVGIYFSGSMSGGGNGDSRYWYVNAIRIG